MKIVLLGSPGAGKGTQCKHIVERYGLVHLSSGDILRRERSEGTKLGKKARGYMDAGELVPDDIVIEMMIEAIKKAGPAGYILDGFPRTVVQAKKLDEALGRVGERIDIILNLKIADKIVIWRITGRRSCPECGAVYHIENMKPKVEGICDYDGSRLIQRPDDKPEVVKKRLEAYYKQTTAVVDYYQRTHLVYHIDAGEPLEKILAGIFEKLDALVASQACGSG
jgi:adenylate kinase